jgi:hypothetical protein
MGRYTIMDPKTGDWVELGGSLPLDAGVTPVIAQPPGAAEMARWM